MNKYSKAVLAAFLTAIAISVINVLFEGYKGFNELVLFFIVMFAVAIVMMVAIAKKRYRNGEN